MFKTIINYLGLQLGWLACAWGAANEMIWLGPVVVSAHLGLHLLWSDSRHRQAVLIGIVILLGLLLDGAQKASGLVVYAGNFPTISWLAPAWIIAMWALFATSVGSSLKWLQKRYALAALLGAIFGPLSYRAGAAMGAASFPLGDASTLGVLAIIWGATLPLLFWINAKLQIQITPSNGFQQPYQLKEPSK